MPVIVNADDFGMSESVNEQTCELIDKGLITSTTLLGNGPAFHHAVEQIRERSGRCSVGVHLNLIEFRPLTRHAGLGRLLDSDGLFRNAIRRTMPIPSLLEAAYAEWCAQIERVIAAGITPSHIDSHQHVHTLPQLAPVVCKLQREFRLPRIRRTKSIYYPLTPRSFAAGIWRGIVHAGYRAFGGSVTTHEFTDVHSYLATRVTLRGVETLEVMVHAWVPEDVEALHSPAWAKAIQENELIRYDELPLPGLLGQPRSQCAGTPASKEADDVSAQERMESQRRVERQP